MSGLWSASLPEGCRGRSCTQAPHVEVVVEVQRDAELGIVLRGLRVRVQEVRGDDGEPPPAPAQR